MTDQTARSFWRIIITAGTGFFTDAYDLFIIGVVTAILAPIWHLSTTQLAVLNGSSLVAAAVGAIFFGTLSDKFGRKKLYGLEIAILFFGAILSAFSPNFMCLLVARVIVGLGIGGDYPSSAVVASEYSTTSNRGYLVLLVFAMQALGLIVGPLIASLLLASQLHQNLVWRILLGLGAIPAALVFFMRRRIKETSQYVLAQQGQDSPLLVSRVVRDLAKEKPSGLKQVKKHSLLDSHWLLCLIGTSSAWFFLDVAFYGNGISSVLILNSISPHAGLLSHTVISAMIFLIFAVPGYFCAARYVDVIGRKPLQFFGFAMIALCYALIAFIPHLSSVVLLFGLVYGISYFFVNFGPNATTFLIPSEIYPSSIRAKAHGISAAVGKVGAFAGAFALPFLLESKGMQYTMALMAVVAVLGILSTFLIPEMKNKSLSETEHSI